jgi:hypothetical protein
VCKACSVILKAVIATKGASTKYWVKVLNTYVIFFCEKISKLVFAWSLRGVVYVAEEFVLINTF